MTILAQIAPTKVGDYKNFGKAYRLVPTTKKDGSEGEPWKELLYLNVVVDGEDIESLNKVLGEVNPDKSIIKVVTIEGEAPSGLVIPMPWSGRVFSKGGIGVVDGMVNLIEKSGVPNLYELSEEAKANPTYRFIGGKLLAVEGVPVGMFDEGVAKDYGILGKELPQVVFEDGRYDFFSQDELDTVLEDWGEGLITEGISQKKPKMPIVRKLKEKKPKKKKAGVKKSLPKAKVSKKKETFSRLFSQKVDF